MSDIAKRVSDSMQVMVGVPILRFTGSEIYANPAWCAMQVLEFMSELLVPENCRRSAG